MTIEIVEVTAEVTRALRLAVLRADHPDYSTAPGDAPGARHLAAFDSTAADGSHTLVGAVVLLPEPCPLWPERPAHRLRGMAVAPARQGQGVGTLLLDAAVAVATPAGLVWCNARTTARGFYERHGFTVDGPEFRAADSGVPHFLMYREMYRELPGT